MNSYCAYSGPPKISGWGISVMGRRKNRYIPFETPLVFANGEHKDASLVERYRLDVNQLRTVAGLPELLQQWVHDNLVVGEGIRYRDHSLKYRLDRYAHGRPVLRRGQWHHAERLADDDLACIRDITAWFRRSDYEIVEVGFNQHVQICKMAMNVALPTGNVLFLAIGVDRGLKTFFVRDCPKEAGVSGFHCRVPGCEYATAAQLFLKTSDPF